MKMLAMSLLLCLVFPALTFATDAEDNLKDRLKHRNGAASRDARSTGAFGTCSGNTFRSDVTIQDATVSINGDLADVYVDYSGTYTRQGWSQPCVQGGHEDRNVSGRAHFTIRQRGFGSAETKYIGVANLGEVNDVGHDSNVYAVQAVINAFSSAIQ